MKKEQIKKVLAEYKTLDVSLQSIKDAFGESMRFVKEGVNYRLVYNPPVYVENEDFIEISVSDLEIVLTKYLEGKINKHQLQDWANFILMCEFYKIAPNATMLHRKILLSILHELDSLEMDKAFGSDVVRYYLNRIKTKDG